jgi:hypothetical protein
MGYFLAGANPATPTVTTGVRPGVLLEDDLKVIPAADG